MESSSSCVVSLLSVNIKNVGVPWLLRLDREDFSLDNAFRTACSDIYNISLNRYTLLSGQGAALRSICEKVMRSRSFVLRICGPEGEEESAARSEF
jgi:hypothetical protein